MGEASRRLRLKAVLPRNIPIQAVVIQVADALGCSDGLPGERSPSKRIKRPARRCDATIIVFQPCDAQCP